MLLEQHLVQLTTNTTNFVLFLLKRGPFFMIFNKSKTFSTNKDNVLGPIKRDS